jgi:hypothetical protein
MLTAIPPKQARNIIQWTESRHSSQRRISPLRQAPPRLERTWHSALIPALAVCEAPKGRSQ